MNIIPAKNTRYPVQMDVMIRFQGNRYKRLIPLINLIMFY